MGCCCLSRDEKLRPDGFSKSPKPQPKPIRPKSPAPSAKVRPVPPQPAPQGRFVGPSQPSRSAETPPQRGTQPRIKDTVSGPRRQERPEPSTQTSVSVFDGRQPVGLENLGNSCYMNSILQCLARAPEFLETLQTATDPLLVSLAQLLSTMRQQAKVVDSLRAFRKVLGTHLPKFKSTKQEDAKDLLLELLTYTERTHRPAAELFYGKRADKVTCTNCGNQTPAEAELFLVPIERRMDSTDISSYLQRAQNDEFQLTGDNRLKCSRCQSQSDASVVSKIVKSPKLLVVYIEPFDLAGSRIRHSISVTEQVTLLSRKYALYGVVYHHGSSIHSGHFTAAVRYYEVWYRCDDNSVREVESPSSAEAYFLFYEALD